MPTEEYLRPRELIPVRKPRPPKENETPVLLIVIRNGPIENDFLNIQPILILRFDCCTIDRKRNKDYKLFGGNKYSKSRNWMELIAWIKLGELLKPKPI